MSMFFLLVLSIHRTICNNYLSEACASERGMRQGCLLSLPSLIYDLCTRGWNSSQDPLLPFCYVWPLPTHLNLFPVLAVRYARRAKDQKSVSGVVPETPISAPFVWNILSYFAISTSGGKTSLFPMTHPNANPHAAHSCFCNGFLFVLLVLSCLPASEHLLLLLQCSSCKKSVLPPWRSLYFLLRVQQRHKITYSSFSRRVLIILITVGKLVFHNGFFGVIG